MRRPRPRACRRARSRSTATPASACRAAADRIVHDHPCRRRQARGEAVLGLATGDHAQADLLRVSSRSTRRANSRSPTSRPITSTSITRSARATRSATGPTCTSTCSATSTSPRTAPTCSTAPSPSRFAAEHAAQFDRWIAADGGLDLQLLGLGRNGHIGFNEPSDLPVADALRAADPPGGPAPDHPRPTPPATSAASRK